MDTISIAIPISTFERLQAEAVPLVDTIDSVLLRLLKHYEAHVPVKPGLTRYVANMPSREDAKTFRTSRGVVLPIMSLHAKYDGKVIDIQLTKDGFEWNGQRFDDPSSVAVAVKKSMGASDTTASTNGWRFWYIGDSKTVNADLLDTLRPGRRGSLASRLA